MSCHKSKRSLQKSSWTKFWYFNHMVIFLCQVFKFYPVVQELPLALNSFHHLSPMKVKEIRVHEEDPICPLIIIASSYWRWDVATECCRRNWEFKWKGKSKWPCRGHSNFQRTIEEVSVISLALPDTDTSLDLGDNHCESLEDEHMTGRVSGKVPFCLGVHSLDFKHGDRKN